MRLLILLITHPISTIETCIQLRHVLMDRLPILVIQNTAVSQNAVEDVVVERSV